MADYYPTTVGSINEDEISSSLTPNQEQILAILPVISATLSILGSCLILYLNFKTKSGNDNSNNNDNNNNNNDKTRKNSSQSILLLSSSNPSCSYRRIILGLCICNIILSIVHVFQPLLIPATTSRRPYAIGTDRSCIALGFLFQFSFTVLWYNGMLSFDYLYRIRDLIKTNTITTASAASTATTVTTSVSSSIDYNKNEAMMHTIVLGYNLLMAAFGIVFQFYGEINLGVGCWLTSSWCDNTKISCIIISRIIGWFFAGLPFIFILLSIVVNNIMISYHVRNYTNDNKKVNKENLNSRVQNIDEEQEDDEEQCCNNNKTMNENDDDDVSITICSIIQQHKQQSILYMGSFFLCYSWMYMIKLCDYLNVVYQNKNDTSSSYIMIKEDTIFPLLVLYAFFTPLQGFCMFWIYIRPEYIYYCNNPNFFKTTATSKLNFLKIIIQQILWDGNNDINNSTSYNTTNGGKLYCSDSRSNVDDSSDCKDNTKKTVIDTMNMDDNDDCNGDDVNKSKSYDSDLTEQSSNNDHEKGNYNNDSIQQQQQQQQKQQQAEQVIGQNLEEQCQQGKQQQQNEESFTETGQTSCSTSSVLGMGDSNFNDSTTSSTSTLKWKNSTRGNDNYPKTNKKNQNSDNTTMVIDATIENLRARKRDLENRIHRSILPPTKKG